MLSDSRISALTPGCGGYARSCPWPPIRGAADAALGATRRGIVAGIVAARMHRGASLHPGYEADRVVRGASLRVAVNGYWHDFTVSAAASSVRGWTDWKSRYSGKCRFRIVVVNVLIFRYKWKVVTSMQRI
jgi:hypothetical protein